MNGILLFAVLFVFGLASSHLGRSFLARGLSTRQSIDLDDLYELLESDIPLPRYRPNSMELNADYEIKSRVFEICSRKNSEWNQQKRISIGDAIR